MRLTIEISDLDRANVEVLKANNVDISAVCREAIAVKAQEINLQRKFIIGDDIRVTRAGYLHNKWGTVIGYHRSYVTILLDDRRMIMMFPQEMEHREYQDA